MLHAKRSTAQVRVHDAVPFFLRDSYGRSKLLLLDTGIVESKVQTPECLRDFLNRLFRLGGVAT